MSEGDWEFRDEELTIKLKGEKYGCDPTTILMRLRENGVIGVFNSRFHNVYA